jgi:hypothetical protein
MRPSGLNVDPGRARPLERQVVRSAAKRPRLPAMRRSRSHLGLLGAVLLIALHVFMVETTGAHVHAPPVPTSAHPASWFAGHSDTAGDEGAPSIISWTAEQEPADAPLACLAILAGLVLLRMILRARAAAVVAPTLLMPMAADPTPRTPPPVAHCILRI